MKRIDELCVSRRPWELMDDGLAVVTKLDEDVYGVVAECRESADARLIAAAPELYLALREVQECFDHIRSTAWFMDANFASIEKMNKAQNEAHKALAKAAGEEVAK